MGKVVVPPLSQFELEQAANAAAAIVTRCSMNSEDGFVDAATLFDAIRRPSTRGSVTFDLKAVEFVLAHSNIRARLIERGFKFERSHLNTDVLHHGGCEYRMHRFGSSISGRDLPLAGSEEEHQQVTFDYWQPAATQCLYGKYKQQHDLPRQRSCEGHERSQGRAGGTVQAGLQQLHHCHRRYRR